MPPTPNELILKAIVDNALRLADGPKRVAYLDRACQGQEATLRRVEALLQAHAEQPRFPSPARESSAATSTPRLNRNASITLEDPAPRTDPIVAPSPEAGPVEDVHLHRPVLAEGPGSIVGPYKILQKLGEGGMGVVFMAEQERPIRRKVALKVIRPGMGTSQVIARFEAERQALAIMDHPHIARVFDVGSTAADRPFFVMELVRGEPITEYCDRNQVSTAERLKLFIPVCRAIQHAHQKGIIHRDIKPSNVLITLHDGLPVPKIIDFGVAKAVDHRLTEQSLFTQFGDIVGTLEYMSPEQAEMGTLDIDTRSDIYSLGVLLYELLTGSTPLERSALRKAAHAEILRLIREVEPPKPSTRLIESQDALPSLSSQRKTEPARLTRLIRGDLDWIVMKSLEKDRTRRYETAVGLARDIQRHLAGDAVEASPPSVSYKLGKFARKHRVALATAGAFGLLLVAATTVSITLAYWANQERLRADKQKTLLIDAECRASDRGDRVLQGQQMAIEAVQRYGEIIRETPKLKNDPALENLRKQLLGEAQLFFQKLRDRLQEERAPTSESLARLVSACFELGKLNEEIGDRFNALQAFEQSREIQERMACGNPANLQLKKTLAQSFEKIGDLRTGLRQPTEAMKSYERVVTTLEPLALDHPEQADLHSELARTWNRMAWLDLDQGRLVDASGKFRKAVDSMRKALAAPCRPDDCDFLSRNLRTLARTAQWAGLVGEADSARREQEDIDTHDPEKLALDIRLSAILEGGPARDHAERLKLAHRAYEKNFHAASTRLYAEALTLDRDNEDDLPSQNTYRAICSAALAGSGQGRDDPPIDPAAQAQFRRQSLDWLRSEARILSKLLDARLAEKNPGWVGNLQHWRQDPDLFGIRDESCLAKLPEPERAQFRGFWAEVEQLQTRAEASK